MLHHKNRPWMSFRFEMQTRWTEAKKFPFSCSSYLLNAILFPLNLIQDFVPSKNFGSGFGNSRYETVAPTV